MEQSLNQMRARVLYYVGSTEWRFKFNDASKFDRIRIIDRNMVENNDYDAKQGQIRQLIKKLNDLEVKKFLMCHKTYLGYLFFKIIYFQFSRTLRIKEYCLEEIFKLFFTLPDFRITLQNFS